MNKLSCLVLLGTLLVVGSWAGATTFYPISSGNWSNPDIWSPYTGDVPTTGDVACSSGAWEIEVDGQQNIATIQCGYYTGTADNYGWMRMDDPAAVLNVSANLYVSYPKNCNGGFRQFDGTVNVTTFLEVKYEAGTNSYSTYPGGTSWGKYELYGGSLTTGKRSIIGNAGKGFMTQSGGTHTTPWLMIGSGNKASLGAASDVAYYTMTGGTLNVTTDLSLGVNVSARGVFNFGDANTTGTITGTGNLRCRHGNNASDGIGIFQGWGTVGLTGVLYMNDKVIANSWSDDTTQADRDLDMSTFSSVTNDDTLIRTVGEGWYATNRARLILPALTVAAGSSTKNWGEDAADTAIDLVNSVAMAFTDVTGGKVSVALNAKDRSDVGLADQNVIGVWAFDGSAFDFGSGSASLTFKYDDAAAATLGLAEANLKVYAKVAGNWTEVTAMIDTAAHQLTIANQTAFTTIAIGEIAAQQVQGDANGDGKVDVSDLGILAANYGMTSGATLAQGDFNGDGAVDVSDLGILAANYGTGTQAGADFNADYAKVFGTAADKEATEDTTSSACSSLGLSLIAGLAMLGLMLVKLED